MKILIFTVGWTGLMGDFEFINTPHERGWSMKFAKDPNWMLPPTVGFLLKAPLRRPFQGEGIPVRFSIKDTPGSQTVLNRRGTLVALTDKGRQVVDEAVVAHLANEERLLTALSPRERGQLTDLLRKLLLSEPFAKLEPTRSLDRDGRATDPPARVRPPRRR